MSDVNTDAEVGATNLDGADSTDERAETSAADAGAVSTETTVSTGDGSVTTGTEVEGTTGTVVEQ